MPRAEASMTRSEILYLLVIAAPGTRIGVHHSAKGIEQCVLVEQPRDLVFFERGSDFVRNMGEDELHPGFSEGVVDRTQGRGAGEIDVVDGGGVDAEPL